MRRIGIRPASRSVRADDRTGRATAPLAPEPDRHPPLSRVFSTHRRPTAARDTAASVGTAGPACRHSVGPNSRPGKDLPGCKPCSRRPACVSGRRNGLTRDRRDERRSAFHPERDHDAWNDPSHYPDSHSDRRHPVLAPQPWLGLRTERYCRGVADHRHRPASHGALIEAGRGLRVTRPSRQTFRPVQCRPRMSPGREGRCAARLSSTGSFRWLVGPAPLPAGPFRVSADGLARNGPGECPSGRQRVKPGVIKKAALPGTCPGRRGCTTTRLSPGRRSDLDREALATKKAAPECGPSRGRSPR